MANWGTATILRCTCALLDSGSVRCWGTGADGRLGYGNDEFVGLFDTPFAAGDVEVGGLVEQIVAGQSHTCALLTSGGVRCWGLGADGRLGYRDSANVGDVETPARSGNVPLL
jgi:alpha-tubulin suppressor-like RCC1 family protein